MADYTKYTKQEMQAYAIAKRAERQTRSRKRAAQNTIYAVIAVPAPATLANRHARQNSNARQRIL